MRSSFVTVTYRCPPGGGSRGYPSNPHRHAPEHLGDNASDDGQGRHPHDVITRHWPDVRIAAVHSQKQQTDEQAGEGAFECGDRDRTSPRACRQPGSDPYVDDAGESGEHYLEKKEARRWRPVRRGESEQ